MVYYFEILFVSIQYKHTSIQAYKHTYRPVKMLSFLRVRFRFRFTGGKPPKEKYQRKKKICPFDGCTNGVKAFGACRVAEHKAMGQALKVRFKTRMLSHTHHLVTHLRESPA